MSVRCPNEIVARAIFGEGGLKVIAPALNGILPGWEVDSRRSMLRSSIFVDNNSYSIEETLEYVMSFMEEKKYL